MSMEITQVHYDPNPKHIIIRSNTTTIDCASPLSPTSWLDGTLGDVVCVYSNQYMHFEKALCDFVVFYDTLLFFSFKHVICGSCGTLNSPMCCLNTTPLNSFTVKDSAENCLTVP